MNKIKHTGDQKVDGLAPQLCTDWITLEFLECIEQSPGIQYKLKKSEIQNEGKIPVIDQGENFITGYTNKSTAIYSGAIPLIIFGDHTRHIKYVDTPFAVGADGTKIIHPKRFYDTRFFYHYLNTLNWQDIGYTRHYKYLKQLTIPLPPLNEQKRIVAKLDKIVPRIAAVKEQLDKVPAIVKRFKQSVLTAAVTGKLTEKWRAEHPEVESAEVLCPKNKRLFSHEEYRNIWNDFEIPESWTCIHLKEIADLRLGKMLDGHKNTGKETEYIRNVNVRWFQFALDDLKTIKVQAEEIQKLSIKNGDVFICEGGEPGRAAVWQLGKNEMTFQKALHRVRFNGKVVPSWLVYNLKVDADTDRLSKLFTGSTIKHFTGRSLAEYPLTLPPLEEQTEIVRQVDKLFALADRLESHYQKAKARVNKLSQSVLAKAFRGELVITEAELAKKEGRDFESAEKLLERTLEEKAKLVGSRQRNVGGVRSARGRKGKQKETGGGINEKN